MQKENQKAYLIGAGIASLAAAVYLIKEGGFDGKNIFIFEESNIVGGSLDGKGSPEAGYIARGGRMFSEEVYNCTYDLLSRVPIEGKKSKTLLDDFVKFNKEIKTYAKARLVEKGQIADSSIFGVSISDSASMLKVLSFSESRLGDSKISDHFSKDFFKTNFWFEWCTTFAFEPWHSAVEFRRYVYRFIQELPRVNTMTGIRHTRYSQHDSISVPTVNWLKKKGVDFLMGSRVTALNFGKIRGKEQVDKITYLREGEKREFFLGDDDLVFFTNGSMTTNSTFGSLKTAPILNREAPKDSWELWKNIAKNRPHFGNPAVFNKKIDKTKWVSFSVTFRDKIFSDLMEDFTKNKPGTGGLVTVKDSNWLLTLVTPPQPHFINQTPDVNVFWGYGLYPDKKGNFVDKKMSECSGEEIMIEVCEQLRFSTADTKKVLKSMNCIPCMMPYITSQFMPRKKGDRPKVIPSGTRNFAFIGQYCEIPEEIVFTVEQSVRSAMIAVYGLLEIQKEVLPIYHGNYSPMTVKDLLMTGIKFGLTKITPTNDVVRKKKMI